jgi:hypothetical protein
MLFTLEPASCQDLLGAQHFVWQWLLRRALEAEVALRAGEHEYQGDSAA